MNDIQSAEIDDMIPDLKSCLHNLSPFGIVEWSGSDKAKVSIPMRALAEMLYLRGFRKVND